MYRKEPWEWMIRGGFALLSLALFALAAYAAFKEEWQVEASQRIAAPPAAVFAYLTEPDRRVTWQPNLLDLAPLTGEPGEVGATRMLFMGGEGRRWQEEETQLALEPASHWAVARDGPEAERRIEIRLEPDSDGAVQLIWRERVSYKALENRLLAPLTVRNRRDRLADALRRLADLAGRAEDDTL